MKATNRNTGLQKATLTVAQESAIDALVSGNKDAEVADLVGINRVTVTRWRLYNPHFQAALNERRQAIWAASLDRFRSLVPLALDAVADELTNAESPNRLQAALGLLKLLPLTLTVPRGPIEPDEIVKRIVEDERSNAHNSMEDILDHGKGLPMYKEHIQQVWDELSTKLASTPAKDVKQDASGNRSADPRTVHAAVLV